ncbi:DUF4157 domain-containing protein [Roseomonas sp. HF4]|uniref:eCIS core domain-containing protein n=1 Tax=Roseomonas sp. HF4 TaxID=2562313 RepID=UPI0010C14453|nr:DUF4157 domain-containing protein [Roseomonas sp. HF4]
MSGSVTLINGQPSRKLEAVVTTRMAQAFGAADLSGVRPAGAGRAGTSAQAYVTGNDVFVIGRHGPNSAGGQALAAHEAVHVVQQQGSAWR